jgi:hypothetical protein
VNRFQRWRFLSYRGSCGPGWVLLREVFPDVAVEIEDVVVVELIEDLAAFLPVGDEPGGAEGAELVGNGGLRGGEVGGEIADAVLRIFQQGDEAQAGGIGEDGEEFAHALGFGHTQRRRVRRRDVVVFLTNGFVGWTGGGAGHLIWDTIFCK